MNENHLQQIFTNYIDKFNVINNSENYEYYKWQIVKEFRGMMDEALAAPAAEFPARLLDLKKLSSNLIDNYTQPFYGLVKFAEEEPETVRGMFKSLFEDDGGDIEARQNRVRSFLKECHRLREEYSPDSFLYKNDVHSVTAYLFLYDPDHNYIFKATHALSFADCVEFYDDWSTGENVRLDVYYRMCDQLVEKIKQDDALMETDGRRFSGDLGISSETLYPDPEKHVLAFDIIYCCSTYGLFSGITFERKKASVRAEIPVLKEKARRLYEDVMIAREKMKELEAAKAFIDSVYLPGTVLIHKKYGEGVVTSNSGTMLVVEFQNIGEKKFGTYISVANGILSLALDGYSSQLEKYKPYLMNEEKIKSGLISSEKEFEPYAKYLD